MKLPTPAEIGNATWVPCENCGDPTVSDGPDPDCDYCDGNGKLYWPPFAEKAARAMAEAIRDALRKEARNYHHSVGDVLDWLANDVDDALKEKKST